MNIEIKRLWQSPQNAEFRETTTGTLSLDGQQVCFTLEPTSLMIPAGTYGVRMVWSPRFERMTPHVDVPGRTGIELHGGNRAENSEGCILCAEFRLSDYEIYSSKTATDAIEEALLSAEANSEVSTVTVYDLAQSPQLIPRP